MADLSPLALASLTLVALFAGFVDAIAGGGGAITVPALMAMGLPDTLALGTNKGQAIFGSSTALWRYARAGLVDRRRACWAFLPGLVGAVLGAQGILLLPREVLRPIVLVLLAPIALFLLLRGEPRPGIAPRAAWIAAPVALAIGAYDGFFGPGTGTFLLIAFLWLFRSDPQHATADAKVVNFASNLGALLLFASQGTVLWRVALPMAAAQTVGAWLGARSAIQGGNRWVRLVAFVVTIALMLKLALELR